MANDYWVIAHPATDNGQVWAWRWFGAYTEEEARRQATNLVKSGGFSEAHAILLVHSVHEGE